MPRRLAVQTTIAFVAAATVFGASGATAVAATAPALASQNPSPYATAGCLALEPQPGSLSYLNSEVEPQVAVDPTNPSHLVGAWQQDRWSNGGAHGLVASYSNDGGASWQVSPQPFSACYHASGFPGAYLNYQRASDPWVSIGPGAPAGSPASSTVYSVSLSFDQTPFPGDPNALHNAVGAATSYDGGATWTNVQTIIDDPCLVGTPPGPGYQCNNAKSYVFNDKESVTADPVHPGVAYAVWDRLVAPPATGPGFVHERAYFGPALISKTTDFGKTWSHPRVIVGLPSIDQTIGNQIVVDRQTGALYDFFNLIQGASNAGGHRRYNVAFVKSTDGGATWSAPSVVAALQTVGQNRVSDPNNLNPATNAPPARSRTGDIIPEAAINYFQWPSTVSGNEPTNLLIRHSTTPGSSAVGPAFDDPTTLDGPFNNLAAPYALGYFLGDYMGLVANANGFIPFYVKTNCSDGNATTQPSCRAIQSVLNPTNLTPTKNDSTDVYAVTGA